LTQIHQDELKASEALDSTGNVSWYIDALDESLKNLESSVGEGPDVDELNEATRADTAIAGEEGSDNEKSHSVSRGIDGACEAAISGASNSNDRNDVTGSNNGGKSDAKKEIASNIGVVNYNTGYDNREKDVTESDNGRNDTIRSDHGRKDITASDLRGRSDTKEELSDNEVVTDDTGIDYGGSDRKIATREGTVIDIKAGSAYGGNDRTESDGRRSVDKGSDGGGNDLTEGDDEGTDLRCDDEYNVSDGGNELKGNHDEENDFARRQKDEDDVTGSDEKENDLTSRSGKEENDVTRSAKEENDVNGSVKQENDVTRSVKEDDVTGSDEKVNVLTRSAKEENDLTRSAKEDNDISVNDDKENEVTANDKEGNDLAGGYGEENDLTGVDGELYITGFLGTSVTGSDEETQSDISGDVTDAESDAIELGNRRGIDSDESPGKKSVAQGKLFTLHPYSSFRFPPIWL
jgi:hypothetical protein